MMLHSVLLLALAAFVVAAVRAARNEDGARGARAGDAVRRSGGRHAR
jgi:hypothetical protein